MTNDLKTHLSSVLNNPITKISNVHGGDISKACRIDTLNKSYFFKFNSSSEAAKMFQAEATGLQLIGETNTIKTPKALTYDTFQNSSFLLMEFIESKSPSSKDFINLGVQLAELHNCTSEYFGLNKDNFIGSLPQYNKPNVSWSEFYATERLLPQLELAKQKHLLSDDECPSRKQIKTTLETLFSNIKPVLLHGDLWSGNYLIAKDGTPYLIDPAVYYGHHEVDIAMTKLFGGFSNDFYDAYFNLSPSETNSKHRIDIYQLYYLLVHLNMFGNSYYGSVRKLLKKHF